MLPCQEKSTTLASCTFRFSVLNGGRLRLLIVASLDVRADENIEFELPVLGEAAVRNGTFEMGCCGGLGVRSTNRPAARARVH